jgi:hypothetical protein
MGINFDRGAPKDSLYNKFRDIVETATESLRGVAKDKQASVARISLWNCLFPDFQIPVTTDVAQHFVDILRRHLLRCTRAHRFCFELAAFFIDLPAEFHRIITVLPIPYTVAMSIAFRVLHEAIEYPTRESVRLFVGKVLEDLPQPRLVQFTSLVRALQTEDVNIERILNKMSQLLTVENFDLLLVILPPHLRLHFALKFGRPLPHFKVDFAAIKLPFEFIQAIADIEGEEEADSLVLFEPPADAS